MKARLVLLVLALSISFISYSQTKPKTTTTTKREIDRLADKYKGKDPITIYLTNSELIGSVNVEYNQDNKPLGITIAVNSQNKEELAEFTMNMIQQKQSQGYVSTEGWLHTLDGISNLLANEKNEPLKFKKGNMYFIVYMYRTIWNYSNIMLSETILNPNSTPSFQDIKNKYPITYYVTIETMDYSRKGGSKATKLDF